MKPCTYPGVREGSYLISNYGKVYSNLSHRLLTPYKDSKGYMRVELMCNDSSKNKNFKIHRLVAWEFCKGYDENEGRIYPNHLDGIRDHNYYENIPWSTNKENSIHGFNHGKRKNKSGKDHYKFKYDNSLIKFIKTLLNNNYTTNDIMKYFGYNQSKDNIKLASLISDIKKRKKRKRYRRFNDY